MTNNESGWRCSDSDSSMFSWSAPGVRNPAFPMNYMDEIERLVSCGGLDAVLVSSHETVRRALRKRRIPFLYVLPERSLMDEWAERCRLRGSTDGFIRNMTDNWDSWTSDTRYASNVIRLGHGEHLSDIVGDMDPIALLGIHACREDGTGTGGTVVKDGVGETICRIDGNTGIPQVMDGWDGYGVEGFLRPSA